MIVDYVGLVYEWVSFVIRKVFTKFHAVLSLFEQIIVMLWNPGAFNLGMLQESTQENRKIQ